MAESAATQLNAELNRLQGWVTGGLCFIVVFAITVTSIMVWEAYRVGQTAAQTKAVSDTSHTALCALRRDYQRRFDSTAEYLRDHPGPEPFPGISRQSIIRGQEGLQITIDAFSVLDC